jgi:hypothetical protein
LLRCIGSFLLVIAAALIGNDEGIAKREGEQTQEVFSPAPRTSSQTAITKPLTVSSPVTVNLNVTDEVRAAIAELTRTDRGKTSVRLIIEGAVPPPRAKLSVRAFLNKPDANVATSIEDPHYIGSFSFFPSGDQVKAGERGQNFTLDLDSTIRRLAEIGESISSRPISVALVATSTNPKSNVTEAPITIRAVGLRLINSSLAKR